ncbi:MAG TPA: cytochrome c biogenesis protein CcdA [Syntrophales bacterium]|nr:cytochrome c biogenesis protein CcdA [Syntrophales bacterium]
MALESVFLTINEWMTGAPAWAALGAFFWGMVSVLFSPCHLASIPLIVAYVGGQEKLLQPREAAGYAVVFTAGLFITIALIGAACAFLGRMLGDVGSFWQIPVGLILIWVALGMMGVESCSSSSGLLHRLRLRGMGGAFLLGLAYGVLSGACTFGFIAPILALIAIQKEIAAGLTMIVLFALGHCLPIVLAGSSSAFVRRVVENQDWQGAGAWFRRGAGAFIAVLGVYFIGNPFWGG